MKMKALLFGVIFGLLAVVYSIPVSSATQDDIYREAVTDGYLIDDMLLPSLTKEPPKINATVPPSQQPSSEPRELMTEPIFEGSGLGEPNFVTTTSVTLENGGEQYATTAVSEAQSSTSTALPGHTDDATSHSTPTHRPQSASTLLSVSNKAHSSIMSDNILFSIPDLLSSGSGSGEEIIHYDISTLSRGRSPVMTSHFSTEATTASSTSADIMFEESTLENGSGMETAASVKTKLGHIKDETSVNAAPQNKAGNGAPGWIIIVGFVVGVAALVMLCVAIATRDKWNGPSQAFQQETKTIASNQQMELEMETFLHKDSPRENGKATEYTVIPLDELPDKYSSQ